MNGYMSRSGRSYILDATATRFDAKTGEPLSMTKSWHWQETYPVLENPEAEERLARAMAKIAAEQVPGDPEIMATIYKNIEKLYVK